MRFFIEVAYKGTRYAGSQIQKNAVSIQSILEKNLEIVARKPIKLTGASRTDTGVHALQNTFHFDEKNIKTKDLSLHSINALLPYDIVVKNIYEVASHLHARYNAKVRSYLYQITPRKNPFFKDTAYFYHHPIDLEKLSPLVQQILVQKNFMSFSKKNTQVSNFLCDIHTCSWSWDKENQLFKFHIAANRFLRGMVRALVATQLNVMSNQLSQQAFNQLLSNPKIAVADFSAPAQGLFLNKIDYPNSSFLADKI